MGMLPGLLSGELLGIIVSFKHWVVQPSFKGLERKGFIWPLFLIVVLLKEVWRGGTQARNLGADVEAVGGCCLLTCSHSCSA